MNRAVATVAALLALAVEVRGCNHHSQCDHGKYCDVNHNCFSCSYTFHHACDAVDRADNSNACTNVCGAAHTGDDASTYTFSGLEQYHGSATSFAYLNGVYTRSTDTCNGHAGENTATVSDRR